MARLDLDPTRPRRPAAYGAAGSLTTTPSCPAATARRRTPLGLPGRGREQPRDDEVARDKVLQPFETVAGGAVDEVLAVEVEDVEEERAGGTSARSRPTSTRLIVRAAVSWKGRGRPSPARQGLAVEDDLASRHREDRLDHLRRRSVISSRLRVNRRTSSPRRCACRRIPSSTVDDHPVGAQRAQRRRHVRSRRREHRPQRPPDDEPDPGQGIGAAGQRSGRRRRGIPGQHHRPPHRLLGYVRGHGDGLLHHAVERALAQLARHQPPQELLLGPGRPREQRVDRRPAMRPPSRHPRWPRAR